jgi:hypothetical protein
MKLAIARLVIWPRDRNKKPRVVSFAESGLNLVSGASRSGKSAIIKIIDYCLGSKECKIPKLGPIRRSADWYGIVAATEEGYKLLARRDPDEQDSTDDYMIVESPEPVVPALPEKNSNRAAARGMLARLARLPQSSADYLETGSGYKGRVSFGDMTAFLFQPQSIVANENVMFFKADEEDHARKLREIFPLVLGAVDSDTLVSQHRLAEVRKILERKRRQLEALRGVVKDYAGEVRGRYLVAIELGLIQDDKVSLDSADPAVLLTRLKELSAEWSSGVRRQAPNQDTGAAQRIASLRDRDVAIATQVSALRLRLVHLRELGQARRSSEASLHRERERLASGSWLLKSISPQGDRCPFCGNHTEVAASELAALRERTEQVEAQWRGVHTVAPMLDAEEVEIRRALSGEEEALRQVRAERAQVEQLSDAALKSEEERATFIGRLAEFLQVEEALAADGALRLEIGTLEEEEKALRARVDAAAIAQRKEDALFLVSKYAQHYGGIVGIEKKNALIQLDTNRLTIRVIDETGNAAWLNQIGSGANHLGYHVATLLGLHEFFVKHPIPYVPHLLALDQPSQTQFPDDVDEDVEKEELTAVHKAFEALDDAIERTGGTLQVIVSEHAAKTLYGGIKHLNEVERWRRGRKLIPWHWDRDAQDDNGKRADFALEDLADDALQPALASWLEWDASRMGRVAVRRAVFDEEGIRFEVGVADASTSTEVVVSGLMRRDLTCEFEGPV